MVLQQPSMRRGMPGAQRCCRKWYYLAENQKLSLGKSTYRKSYCLILTMNKSWRSRTAFQKWENYFNEPQECHFHLQIHSLWSGGILSDTTFSYLKQLPRGRYMKTTAPILKMLRPRGKRARRCQNGNLLSLHPSLSSSRSDFPTG